MCISVAPAAFGQTITGIHEAPDGSHVVYYQNVVGSPRGSSGFVSSTRSSAPFNWLVPEKAGQSAPQMPSNWEITDEPRGNALVIPLVTGDFGSVELLRGTGQTPRLLADIRKVLPAPLTRGIPNLSMAISLDTEKSMVVIEQFDIYTIVRAERASAIPQAVSMVDARRRPPLNAELFETLERWYDCPFAVACFNPADQGESKPIAFRYEPKYREVFMIYTMDAHDGGVPDLNARVGLDHTVFASTHDGRRGKEVRYTDSISTELRPYVPSHVVGRSMPEGTELLNGDILVSVESVRAGEFEAYRVLPPNAPARKPQLLSEVLF